MRTSILSIGLLAACVMPSHARYVDAEARVLRLEKKVAELRLIVENLQDRLSSSLSQPSKAQVVAAPISSSSAGTYRVKAGDNFWKIAKRNSISVKALQRANSGLNPRKLRIGAILQIPGSHSTSSTPSSYAVSTHSRPTSAGSSSYRIKQGDTLGHIAQRYGLSSRDLLAINPGLNPRRLLVGKSIAIPGSRSAHTPPQVVHYQEEPVRETYHPTSYSPEPTAAETYPDDDQVKLVTVTTHRSMGYLASLYGTDVATLNRLNEVNFPSYKMVKVGSEIYVPLR